MAKNEKIKSDLFDWNKEYIWPVKGGKTEKKTIEIFADLSKGINNANKRQQTIDEILKWGGTYRYKTVGQRVEAARRYKDVLSAIIGKGEYNFDDLILDDIYELTKGQSLSSWTKILAAFKPGVFFIYDARVAMALNECTDTAEWRNPSGRKASKEDSVCYFKYLQQLKVWASAYEDDYDNNLSSEIKNAYENAKFRKDQAIMAHLEKMLFMMKDKIKEAPEYNKK